MSTMASIPLIDDSPIKGLFRQIAGAFEQANASLPDRLRRAVQNGALHPVIEVDNRALPPVGPTCRVASPPQISLSLSHLEFLWAYAYATFVFYEAHMRELMVERGYPTSTPEFAPEVKERARQLGDWARSLSEYYVAWPTALPSPRDQSGEEVELAKKANTIFLRAVALLLHHEFAHADCGHVSVRATSRPDEILAMEKEADVAAYESIVGNTSNEQERRIAAWSILIPYLSNLALVRDYLDVYQSQHPDLHHRLGHALERLNFDERHNTDYFTGVCCQAMHEFVLRHRLPLDDFPGKFETATDALEYYMDVVDRNRPAALRAQ